MSMLSRSERVLPVTHVGRYSWCADRGDHLSEVVWKGNPGAGMHHGPCSVGTSLHIDLGEVDPITEAPPRTAHSLRLWEHSQYPRRSIPVGATSRGGYSTTHDEWFTGARDPLVCGGCRSPTSQSHWTIGFL